MKIVHTESSLGWGGQEIRVLSEAQGLARRGHEVKLVCPPQARIHAEAPGWGLEPIALPIAEKGFGAFRSLRDWLKKNACDVMSTHSSTDAWMTALALASLGRPVPMVRTRHISAPVPRNPLSRWLYASASARIVTTGEALKKELVERNGFDAAKIESVPTGIDAQRFRPGAKLAARHALGLPGSRTLVGIVATLRSWKGHRFLVEAFVGLPASAGLVIVGDGPQRAALEALVTELRLGERTVFAGNQRDVLPWLQALDLFALPSYANEGVPQALVQAMLVGLPCVTTHVGSIAELAQHEATALVVPPQDAGALRAALQRLLADPGLAGRLGEAARRHCAEHYSYEVMLDRMEAVYRRVAARGASGRDGARRA
jgi:glycosyltransferase involved in cell wall biosynthesis